MVILVYRFVAVCGWQQRRFGCCGGGGGWLLLVVLTLEGRRLNVDAISEWPRTRAKREAGNGGTVTPQTEQ